MIITKNLSKRFANETAIDYADLTFETGRKYMLLGASGCGKSTFLNLISGILTPDRGEILIDGTDIVQMTRREKDALRIRRFGYIFQDFKLLEEMTVADNIDLLRLEGIDTSGANAILETLGIREQKNKRVRYLSGGQKQRVAIARALIKEPDFILADEPTGNLNYTIGCQVMEQLCAVAAGRTLIAVTHDERLRGFFDEVIDMNVVTGGRYDLSGEEGRIC